MMCKYCEKGAFNTIIESTKKNENFIGWQKEMLATELEDDDNSVIFEMRCGSGYIRLGDRGEMNCIDHEDKMQINYCFNCGKELEK